MAAAARPETSPYTASKGGIGQLTKALAIEWASHHILVNAIAPGYTDTDLNKALNADAAFDGWVKRRCPLGRWGTPEDIAWAIVFLAGKAASFPETRGLHRKQSMRLTHLSVSVTLQARKDLGPRSRSVCHSAFRRWRTPAARGHSSPRAGRVVPA